MDKLVHNIHLLNEFEVNVCYVRLEDQTAVCGPQVDVKISDFEGPIVFSINLPNKYSFVR